jgi:hypothetical protein
MHRRASNHRALRPLGRGIGLRVFAATLIAAVGFAQFSASWHEAGVRHVRCAEHGEMTHVTVSAEYQAPAARDLANGDALLGSEAASAASHEHCGVVFSLRASTPSRVLRLAVRFSPPPVVLKRAGAPAPRPGRSCVLASAPKTSPPTV